VRFPSLRGRYGRRGDEFGLYNVKRINGDRVPGALYAECLEGEPGVVTLLGSVSREKDGPADHASFWLRDVGAEGNANQTNRMIGVTWGDGTFYLGRVQEDAEEKLGEILFN